MADTAAVRTARAGFGPSFHLWMVLAMAFFVFAGFGMTYLGPLVTGTRPHDPPIVHLHGFVFFVWTLLLVMQALLVNVKNVRLHRSLGTFGIAWGALVAFMGLLITIVGSQGVTFAHPSDPPVFFLSYVAPPSFAVIFAMAIRAVKTPQIHRNLILMAMISILMPGINRVYMMALGLNFVPVFATYMTMNALLALTLWHERKVTGAISRPSWIGAAIIVLPQPLNYLISPLKGWHEFVLAMGDLVYYR
jgi:hypothetical protein